MDATALELDAVKFAQLAVQRDHSGRYQEAVFYYKEAAQALIYAGMAGSNLENIQEKINEYLERVQALHSAVQSQNTDPLKSKQQLDLERARFLVMQAFDEDDKGSAEEAIELYTEAVELCLKTATETSETGLQSKLKQLARQALDRAEALKESMSKSSQKEKSTVVKPNQPVRTFFPLGPDFSLNDKPQTIRAVQASESQGQRYTAEEIEVLRKTSKINGIEYVPFMSVDLRERFAFPMPFSDKCGKLPLSPKQKAIFAKWVRPDDLTNNPTMIYTVSSFSIKQTIVSDCSFVASLAISAAYERRYSKKLITSIIYPQNKKGEPEYNPCGKYMVKLHINGVPRKVIIDDQLPVDHNGELLCSYSNNKNELWVSLIEKAYMKVMGGYDFPGSNSNIDLHALTGWIPERIAMHSDNQAFNKDNTFRMLYQRFHKGDVLITTATGVMSEEEGEKWGLVPTHAYAVLDIREYKGLRFLQLKNPWSHLRWKGRYSENDTRNWTPDLQKYLNFDPRTAQKIDNGIFWIAWEDLCQYYDVIYLSWNPSLFKESTCIHSTWDAKQGPVKDAYSLANNPQYKLEVQCPQGGAAVWVLLSRHITDKDDFAHNREFITMVVYKTDGKKVYYPADPPPYIDGIRINSPHYLTKIKLTSPGSHTFTLVVSQYEKQNTIHYTIRVYSLCKFTFSKIPTPYTVSKRVNGQWKGHSAGGCGNFRDSYKNNPIYQFQLDKSGPLLIELRGPRQYSVGFELVMVSTVGDPGSSGFQKKNSGDYRCGFCYLEVENILAGVYNIIPTTFLPQQEGPFFLDFNSATPLKVSQLQ
ncbi:calpain-7 isoform X1 [Apteryx mantelli]|uniref:Calpain-7 isoform X1 n=1 Tax=Apteryx mantelli TaxID=2696672 RepID=A0A8B7J4Z9_9AVES|nr:PREDICTED: calpain-7 isoform X2 [Apteryx mantelli mantelli]XP_025923769.1 calpain-7 isoform X5 [Apteryx rowi]